MNVTAYKYGIYNKNGGKQQRASNVIPGGDPRFQHWLFPVWQHYPASEASSVFLEPHQFVGSRMEIIEKILAGEQKNSFC